MYVQRRRGWELPESQATPEAVYLSRRTLLQAGAGLIGASVLPAHALAQSPGEADDPGTAQQMAPRNPRYSLDRALTPEELSSEMNNYYEFAPVKNVAPFMSRFQTRPWRIAVDGLVEKPFEIDIDDLLKKMPLEERLYRHRCVEGWSMALPWSGFSMAKLVELARPTAAAKFVRMEAFNTPRIAPNQRDFRFNWPYSEGLTLAEANNELAFLATAVYGKPELTQFGFPLRLVVPWKYGFKSIKAIQRFTFTNTQPVSFWEELQGEEYGFWANVNPQVPHPRWSQETERDIATDRRRPTLLYNGYGEYVAGLYAGQEDQKIWF